MFISKKIIDKAGITLIELLVSLLLTSIVVTIVFFIFINTSKAYLHWDRESSFIGNAGFIMRSLNNAITEGSKILEADIADLTVLGSNLKTCRYEIDNTGRLLKNGMAIIPHGYRLRNMEFKYIIKSEGDSLMIKDVNQLDVDGDFKVTSKELSDIIGIQYSFLLENQNQHGYFEALLMMRNF